jgi:glycosyltransferase involved in cell wall biosynthesis
MRIWLLHTTLPPYRIKLFQAIAETSGVKFKLILLSTKFKTRPEWKRNLHDLPFQVDTPFGISYQTNSGGALYVNPFLLFKLLWKRPDVVICSGFSFATCSVWLGSWLSSVKYVIWSEATHLKDPNVRGVRLWLRRLLARRASAFVDAGTLAREYIRFLRPGIEDARLFRAYNCVDTGHFMTHAVRDETFCRRKGFRRHNILFVGRLDENKGVPRLLEVYRRVLVQRAETALILLGDGPLRSYVENYQRRNALNDLHMEGWVENLDTARYYGAADVFVLLSEFDANPLVIFEALASGIPIVCTNRAGNASDFIKDGTNGYTVDPFNTNEVVARVLEVLSWDRSRREACEKFSRDAVQQANYPDAAKALVEACRMALHPGRAPQILTAKRR